VSGRIDIDSVFGRFVRDTVSAEIWRRYGEPDEYPSGYRLLRQVIEEHERKFGALPWRHAVMVRLCAQVVGMGDGVREFLSTRDTDAARLTTLANAQWWFTILEALVPQRLRAEEMGDAMEFLTSAPRTRWLIWLKTATTTWWVAVNAVREVTSAAWGRVRSSR
jgi:hypothetical protein